MGSITIKTEKEIEIMKKGGRILGEILGELKKKVKPGVSTLELNDFAEKLLFSKKVESAFKGYKGYPSSLCTSVNNVVVHGIPNSETILKSGDLISLDFGLKHQGLYVDAAISCRVGKISETAKKMIKVTKGALDLAISKVKAGVHLGDIGAAIENYVSKKGFFVVKEFCGHGIGKELHEEPQILNFGRRGEGIILKPGMTLCFEPMVNEKSSATKILSNGWTAVTKDGGLAAHFEHTILVTKKGCEVLTKLPISTNRTNISKLVRN